MPRSAHNVLSETSELENTKLSVLISPINDKIIITSIHAFYYTIIGLCLITINPFDIFWAQCQV